MSQQLSRIMRTVQPTKTKKPKQKNKPTPKFVKLPPWKPHSMSDMQWEAMQAQYRQFEDYTCEVNGWEVPDRGERAPVKPLRRWTPSAAAIAYQTTVQSAVNIQRWWWMWRFRKWLPERRKYRKWVRTNNFLPVMIEFEFPFRQDPLLLGKQLLGVNIDKLPLN